MNAGLPMPGLEEVKHYMDGLLALIRGNPQGWSYFDLSARGVNRSFWAMVWCLPGVAIYWVTLRSQHLHAGTDIDTGIIFFFRLALLNLLVWMWQIIVAGFVLALWKKPYHFNAMVVATNWLSVPFSLYGGLLALLQLFFPQGIFVWWMLYNLELLASVYASYAIFKLMKGISAGNALGLAILILATAIVIAPIFQSLMGFRS